MADYAIEGTGDPNTRLDIDDFSTNPEYTIQWSLFLRSLAKLQLAPPEEAIGYYRIAGINSSFIDPTFTKTTLTMVRYSWLATGHMAGT
jgi:hypothetical protein